MNSPPLLGPTIPDTRSTFKAINGPRILCDNQREYLDTTGAGHTLVLSHHVDLVRERLLSASPSPIQPASGRHFRNDWQRRLAVRVRSLYGDSRCLVYFTSGGTEAFEMAVQIAYHVQDIRRKQHRRSIIGRRQSYHGMSLGAMSAGWHPAHRLRLAGALFDWPHLPDSDCAYTDSSECSTACVAYESALGEAAAVIVEPIGGTTSGATVLQPSYLDGLTRAARAAGALVISDEVITGYGRTGSAFAIDTGSADLIIGGKLLAGGLAPLCAVILSGRLVRELQQAGSAPVLRLTFSGNSLACAVGETVQLIASELGLWQHVRTKGEVLQRMLRTHLGQADVEVRGLGLLQAVAWSVESGRGQDDSTTFRHLAEDRGVVVMPGYRWNSDRDSVFTTITPALDSTEDDLAEISECLAAVVRLHLGR